MPDRGNLVGKWLAPLQELEDGALRSMRKVRDGAYWRNGWLVVEPQWWWEAELRGQLIVRTASRSSDSSIRNRNGRCSGGDYFLGPLQCLGLCNLSTMEESLESDEKGCDA